MKYAVLLLWVCSYAFGVTDTYNPCYTKFNWFGVFDAVGSTSRLCVCNEQYCDTFPEITKTGKEMYQIYTTTKNGKRFERTTKIFSVGTSDNTFANHITINPYKKFQTIIGWGGTFTDSVGISIKTLPKKLQRDLMESIFAKTGNEFNLCRVPMGSSDQSLRAYSYDDTDSEDGELEHFALADEDIEYKIPLIHEAINITNSNLKLIAVPYSPPLWMKTNGAWTGSGQLKEEFYQTYANYFLKFLEAYRKEEIDFWGISTGNAPSLANYAPNLMTSLGWDNVTMAKWIRENLGPTMKSSKYKDLKLYILDDVRSEITKTDACIQDEQCIKYVDGVGVQWYGNYFSPPETLSRINENSTKQLDILATSAANGAFSSTLYLSWLDGQSVELGSWPRAANYIEDIILNMQYGVRGWMDYLLVANPKGGISWSGTAYDSPIIVNMEQKEFYKQPMYYALAHFTKFVPEGSQRIDLSINFVSLVTGIQAVAFKRPDNGTAVIVYNRGFLDQQVTLTAANRGNMDLWTERNSLTTILYY